MKRNKHFWKSSASPVLWLLAWNGNSFLSPQVLTDQVKEPIKRNANCKSGNHSLWHKMHYSMKSGSYSCFNFALRYRIIKLYISVNMFVHIYLLVTCKQSSLTSSSLSVWLLRRCQGEKKKNVFKRCGGPSSPVNILFLAFLPSLNRGRILTVCVALNWHVLWLMFQKNIQLYDQNPQQNKKQALFGERETFIWFTKCAATIRWNSSQFSVDMGT